MIFEPEKEILHRDGMTKIFITRHSRQCLICLHTIFRGNQQRAWITENGNHICVQCVDVWDIEGGELGKISRSRIKEGFNIEFQHRIK